jgi:hypothetical protein
MYGQPECTPVNASPIPLRASAHDSGPKWFAIPCFVRLFHSLCFVGFNRRFPSSVFKGLPHGFICAHKKTGWTQLSSYLTVLTSQMKVSRNVHHLIRANPLHPCYPCSSSPAFSRATTGRDTQTSSVRSASHHHTMQGMLHEAGKMQRHRFCLKETHFFRILARKKQKRINRKASKG